MNTEQLKQLLRNPNTYYILVPLAVIVWVLYTWQLALPASAQAVTKQMEICKNAEAAITQILAVDPERLNFQQQQEGSSDFDYTTAIDQFTKLCGIAPSRYSLVGGREIKRGGQKTKSADVTISETDIETLTKFLSTIMARWPDLQCEQLILTKLKTGPNAWKAALKFTYYY